ncbi:MAG: PmoA family protein [Chloroflexota bacterium]
MDPLEIVVKAGPHLRRACPVWVQLPVPPDPCPTLSILDSAGTEVPSQVEVVGMGSDERLALAFIVRDLAAGEVRGYRIVPGPPVELLHNPLPEAPPTDTNSSLPTAATPDLADVAAEVTSSVAVSTEGADPDTPLVVVTETPREKVPGVFLDEVDGRLLIEIDGDLFTAYHFGSDVTRPYFHPLVGPTGASVVRDFPMVEGVDGETSDHPHHRGMWTAHGDVNGHDNWLEGLGKASIRHSGFPRLISGPVYGSFDASAEWIDRWGSVALTDTRRVTVFNLGPDERLVEYAIRVSASHGQVTFGDTKEAGIVSIRVASSMDGPTRDRPGGKGKIETADGSVGEAEAWGRRAAWCDYSGPVGEDIVGIAILDHPTNPRFPTHWHVRDYGLMTVNPFGLHDFTGDTNAHLGDLIVPPYESRVFRYRILIHRGDATVGEVRERYHDFVNPPVVELR